VQVSPDGELLVLGVNASPFGSPIRALKFVNEFVFSKKKSSQKKLALAGIPQQHQVAN
jgi:hypothetical protein